MFRFRLKRGRVSRDNVWLMETVRVTSSGPVTTVTLNRPDARNSFNEVMIAELTEVFGALSDETRAVVLCGEGRVFCAGADVSWMKRSITYTEEQNAEDATAMAMMFRAIDECPCPVIGRVHGASLGGGMGFVGSCDIVVSEDKAVFGYTEVRLGIDPAIISPFSLPKIGSRFARRYYLTGERFDAAQAMLMGLVHEVVPTEALDSTIDSIVEAILASGPEAVATAKRLIREILAMDREEAHAHSIATIARLRVSPEGQEGLAAFLERRKPNWSPTE